jgi:NAD(P)H-dependent FMN reductase
MANTGVPRIALIIGSTRPNRFADVPAKWLFDAAAQRHDMTIETLDLRDWALPFFEEPISFVGYGGVGGARAVEQLRMVAVEMQMVPIKQAVHIGLEPFIGVLMQGKSLDDYPFLAQSRTAMLDRLVWWANALKAARSARAETESIAA